MLFAHHRSCAATANVPVWSVHLAFLVIMTTTTNYVITVTKGLTEIRRDANVAVRRHRHRHLCFVWWVEEGKTGTYNNQK